MLFNASEVAVCWFESQVLSKFTVWVKNCTFLVFSSLKVVLILSGAPLVAFAWVTMSEGLVVAMVMVIVLGFRGPRVRTLRATVPRAKSLIADSWPLLLSGVAVMIYMRIDQIMLGQMVGDETVGIYSAAVRISEIWYFVPMVIVASVFPAILEYKESSEDIYFRRLQLLYDFIFWFSVSVAFVFTFLSSPVVRLLFGVEYGASSAVLNIHIWAGIFVSMGIARGKWLLAENLQHMGYWYVLIGMAVNILGNYLVIPSCGIEGAAFVTLVSQFIVSIVAPFLFKKTRKSTYMLMCSINPLRLLLLFKLFLNFISERGGRSSLQ